MPHLDSQPASGRVVGSSADVAADNHNVATVSGVDRVKTQFAGGCQISHGAIKFVNEFGLCKILA